MDKLLDLTRDFDAAKAAFEAYLDEYDRADDKIHLKIVHTYGVVDAAEDIARRMGLGEEDVQLAKVIGLLHDIGRFEQIKRFDSFEPGTMEHAVYGAQLLFGPEKMIRRFVKDDRFDSLICTAIEKHSDFKLEGITDERTLLHAKLIRDADKLDNCRVKLEESMETLLGVDEKGVGEGVIAPKVWESCMAKESVLSSDRVSKVDYWISYIAQYYDINFPETYEIMREHDYVKRIMDRVPYALPETQEKMDILAAEMEEYMDERIRNKKSSGEIHLRRIRISGHKKCQKNHDSGGSQGWKRNRSRTSPYRSAEDQKICKPEAGVGSGMSGTDKRIPGTEAAERRSERIETKCLYTKSKRNDYQKSFLFCQTHGRFLPQYHHQRTENKMGKL